MTSGCVRLVAVAVTLIATLTTTAIAQEPVVRDSADYRQVLSANPLGLILLPWYNGEYERKVTERVTLGLSGSRLPWGDGGGFYSVNTAFRYYPNGTTFKGFYLGPRIGLFWVSQGQDVVGIEEDRGPHLGLGFELGYAWLLGSEQHLSMSIGFGATRVLNGEPIPVLRLVNVGWAF
jgi:hypothetical protein